MGGGLCSTRGQRSGSSCSRVHNIRGHIWSDREASQNGGGYSLPGYRSSDGSHTHTHTHTQIHTRSHEHTHAHTNTYIHVITSHANTHTHALTNTHMLTLTLHTWDYITHTDTHRDTCITNKKHPPNTHTHIHMHTYTITM